MQRAVRSLALLAVITALLVIAAPITATAADNANVAGEWTLTVETPNGTGSPTVTFKQDGGNLTGTYKGRSGETELKGTVTGNDIKWSVTIHPQGQDLVIEYSGTVDGDTMKGKVTFGSMGEGTFTGKKGAAAAPAPAPSPK
ncbi:MAG TPA: hypothetical protein VIX19_21540 [Terriglobales bacterium]